MKSYRKCILLIALCAGAALTPGRSEVVSGTYTNVFSDLNLWDISGSYDESITDIDVSYTLNMDGAGKLTGAGTFDYDDGWGDYLSGDFTVSGSLKSSGSAVRITFTLFMNGSGMLSYYDVLFSAKATEKLELDGDTREMIGTTSGSVKVTIPELGRKASGSIPKSYQSLTLPDEVDGLWSLTLNAAPVGTKYAGTATIDLSNGKSHALEVTGSYNAKKDVSKLSLKNSLVKSMKLNLVTTCTNLQLNVQSLKGSALGQKLTVK